jgi:hypothetical protein
VSVELSFLSFKVRVFGVLIFFNPQGLENRHEIENFRWNL